MAQNLRINYFDQGHFADITVYQKKNGQIVYRIRHNRGGKGVKTLKTQSIRVRWTNNVRLYQVLRSYLHNSFSDKERNQSDCNRFMQLNFDRSRVCLTRKDSDMGVSVATSVIVSSGILPPVVFEKVDSLWASDICVGDLTIVDSTTVGQLSQAIAANSAKVLPTDDLFLIQLIQREEPTLGYYYTEATGKKLELDEQSRVRVLDQVLPGSLTTALRDGKRYLALPAVDGQYATLVHSRTLPNDRVLTSTQPLVGSNSEALPFYTDDMALLRAIESYGGVDDDNWYRRGTVLDPLGDLRKKAESEDGTTSNNPEEGGTGNTGPTAQQVTVTASVNGGGGTVSPASRTVAQGTSVTFTATPNAGKRVREWSTGATGNSITVVASANRSITVTFEDIPGGSGGGEIENDSFPVPD